jgi:hydroxyacylglutathione hydrolase
MLVKQFVDEGLGNSSYLIASEETGQAAVLDPQRDVDRYLQIADGLGLRLIYTLDTHLHNDFVSGSRELYAQAGVKVGASAMAEMAFDHLPLQDGDIIQLGDLLIRTLATPGHTPEHISFSLTEGGRQAPSALFTGGALIVGGAARTDLLGDTLAEPLARKLYHTIHEKLLQFPDRVAVYPTHGAGSFCAAPVVAERASTIGQERQWNPLILAKDEDDFVQRSLNNLPAYPTYFNYLRRINQRGPTVLGGIPVLKPLDPEEVMRQTAKGAVIIDIRQPYDFAAGHIPGSYGIPLSTPLITWAGWVIPFGSPVILLAVHPADRAEAVRQLIRIGFDDLRGFLEGGIEAWEAEGRPVSTFPIFPAEELAQGLRQGKAPLILDVRSDEEWRAGHLPQAIHVEAGRLPDAALHLPQEDLKVVHCGHSERSTVGLSVLERRGYRDLALLEGGFSGWQAAGFEVVKGE